MSALQYGWNGSRETSGSFWVSFARCTRKPDHWKDELYTAARAIMNRTSKPLWLCFSGGIGSEIMCQAFFDQGINFSVLTLRHSEGTNEHDIAYARDWCQKHGIHQTIESIDMTAFLENGVTALVEEGYVAMHPFRYQQLKLFEIVESFGGSAVLGGGEQTYRIDASKKTLLPQDIFLEFHTGYAAPYEWNKRHDSAHEPYFFCSSPELCLSYLDLPFIAHALEHPDAFRHPVTTYTLKRLAYQSVWHEHASRPKYDGFENIRAAVNACAELLRERFGTQLQTFRISVAQMRDELTQV